jgi:hypothetical protein
MQQHKVENQQCYPQKYKNHSHPRRNIAMMPTWPLCILLDMRDKFESTKILSVQAYPSDGDAEEDNERTQACNSHAFHPNGVSRVHERCSFRASFFGTNPTFGISSHSAANVHTISCGGDQ